VACRSSVLAQRAASEGPRWTRAMGDQLGHPAMENEGETSGTIALAQRAQLTNTAAQLGVSGRCQRIRQRAQGMMIWLFSP
jgi:hypothetical protein